tara:strand:- start:4091 stop:5185 length:1095 start_codon:yes stop_codon:yes gene_type:complete
MFNNIYKNKKVLITGHTGFKGSWLVTWLLELGAKVYGISKDIPTNPSMFEILNLETKITHYKEDIRNLESLKKIILKSKPDFIFHMAAQPIVADSYKDPIDTISSNVLGTANILDTLKDVNFKCVLVVITSDKCYNNVEWEFGYKETDMLGGKDIYSGSKAAAEIIFYSYFNSFLKHNSNIKCATVRAGNVIGGGDWASHRIVPDCIKAWINNQSVEIRSPESTRPWQHVLEPLSGYLNIAKNLYDSSKLNGESFNFGPISSYNKTVKELLDDLSYCWELNKPPSFISNQVSDFHEAGLLKLNCDKALFHLKWMPALDYNILIEFTSQWYYNYYQEKMDMYNFSLDQIKTYTKHAKSKNINWSI